MNFKLFILSLVAALFMATPAFAKGKKRSIVPITMCRLTLNR